jgi:hypothetical protein
MTQKELFDKYVSLSEKYQYMNGQGDKKRQELLEKAEKILDTASWRIPIVGKITINSSEAKNMAEGLFGISEKKIFTPEKGKVEEVEICPPSPPSKKG